MIKHNVPDRNAKMFLTYLSNIFAHLSQISFTGERTMLLNFEL